MSTLFDPLQVGAVQLQHRIVLAPLTRIRVTERTHVPHAELVREYYSQRASAPGTLLITEATLIAQKAGTYPHVPGIWSSEQIEAWRTVVDGVHEKKSFIFLQLWALGRTSDYVSARAEDSTIPYVAPSSMKLSDKEETPRTLTIEEIEEYAQLYATAATNAVHKSGFDGVEIHGANGYLPDQFLQDVSNNRTDRYGGSIENRARFVLDIIDAVVDAVGAERTAIRFSPWSEFQGMRMVDPKPTFSYLVTEIKAKHPNLAYIHLIEPRMYGNVDAPAPTPEEWSNDFVRDIWAPLPLISAGKFTRDTAMKMAETRSGNLVAFGRLFISNPDLVQRLKNNTSLQLCDPSTIYLPGNVSQGYTDYPFAEEST